MRDSVHAIIRPYPPARLRDLQLSVQFLELPHRSGMGSAGKSSPKELHSFPRAGGVDSCREDERPSRLRSSLIDILGLHVALRQPARVQQALADAILAVAIKDAAKKRFGLAGSVQLRVAPSGHHIYLVAIEPVHPGRGIARIALLKS